MAGATRAPRCKLCGVEHRLGAPHDAAGLKAAGKAPPKDDGKKKPARK